MIHELNQLAELVGQGDRLAIFYDEAGAIATLYDARGNRLARGKGGDLHQALTKVLRNYYGKEI